MVSFVRTPCSLVSRALPVSEAHRDTVSTWTLPYHRHGGDLIRFSSRSKTRRFPLIRNFTYAMFVMIHEPERSMIWKCRLVHNNWGQSCSQSTPLNFLDHEPQQGEKAHQGRSCLRGMSQVCGTLSPGDTVNFVSAIGRKLDVTGEVHPNHGDQLANLSSC